MIIDEKVSIRSILEGLSKPGIRTDDIAKEIKGLTKEAFRAALKEAGYEYSKSGVKGWFFKGEGEEPLDKSILDYVKWSSPQVNRSPSKVISFSQGVYSRNNSSNALEMSPVVHQQFTSDEIHMIKEMLKDWQGKKEEKTPEGVGQPLHERIKDLPDNGKTRKTIVIDNKIGERLDEFCKVEKVQKSDVLHLALMDFLEKFQQ